MRRELSDVLHGLANLIYRVLLLLVGVNLALAIVGLWAMPGGRAVEITTGYVQQTLLWAFVGWSSAWGLRTVAAVVRPR